MALNYVEGAFKWDSGIFARRNICAEDYLRRKIILKIIKYCTNLNKNHRKYFSMEKNKNYLSLV